MAKKTTDRIITRDRVIQRICFEILSHHCKELTVNKIDMISRSVSNRVQTALRIIDEEDLELTDQEANDVNFWIHNIINSCKDFNKKPN